MIDLDQKIEIKWSKANKKLYTGLGFEFTKYGDIFIVTPRQLKPNSAVKVKIVCDDCGKNIETTYSNYNRSTHNQTREYYCKSCVHKNSNNITNISKEKFDIFLDFCERNGYKPLSTFDDYKDVKTPLYYECPIHGKHSIRIEGIKDNSIGCKKCYFEKVGNSRMINVDRCIEIIESKGNKLLNPDDYINSITQNLWVECGVCHEPFLTSLQSQIRSNGPCQKCSIKKSKKELALTTEELNNRYNSGNQKILLNPEDYINSHTRNLIFVCRKCGEQYITSRVHYDAGCDRCPKCSNSQSVGEEIIERYLNNKNIQFIPQHRFPDCKDKKTLPFDFYLPYYNLCIEFDGQHHFEPKWGIERFEKTILHDNIKNKYCYDNNIQLIRIPYWEGHNINKILDDKLS